MTTLRALAICPLLVSLGSLAAPHGDVEPGPLRAEVKGGGATLPQLRIAPGRSLAVRVQEAAVVRLGIRVERGLVKKAVSAAIDLDGKFVAEPRLPSTLEADAISDRGFAVAEAVVVEVPIPAGTHRVQVRSPADAPADLLVSVQGLDLSFATDAVAALLPLPPVAGGNKAAPAKASSGPIALPLPPAIAGSPAAAPPREPPEPALQQPPLITAPAVQNAPAEPAATLASAVAMQPSAISAQRLAARPFARGEPDTWSVMLLGGAESSSEQYLPRARVAHLGFEALRTAWATGLMVVQLDWRLSDQTYSSGSPSSPADRVLVDEQRIDAMAGAGYDFGPLLGIDGLTLAPVVGLKYLRIDNRAYPAELFGVDLMGRLRYALSSAVALHGNVGWVYNLVHPSRYSAFGTPIGQLGIRAGLDFPLAGGYALSIDYQGDVIAFDFAYRIAHGAMLGFGRSF